MHYANAGFSGDGTNLGQLTKTKATEYRQLQGSEAGMAQLRENLLQSMKEDRPVTDAQKKTKANAIFDNIKKQVCATSIVKTFYLVNFVLYIQC